MRTRFSYQALTAGDYEVGIAGDFTEWKIYALEDHGGLYLIDFDLDPGRYVYKFIVDGRWMPDPTNPKREADPFGGENSVIKLRKTHYPQGLDEALDRVKYLPSESFITCHRSSEEDLEFRFSWYPKLADRVSLQILDREIPLYPLGVSGGHQVWHCQFRLKSPAKYRLRLCLEERELYLGASGFVEGGKRVLPSSLDPDRYPVFEIPDWARKAVIYQIFMDRFYNGDVGNDQDFSEDYYEGSREPPKPGELLGPHQEYYHRVKDWYDIDGLRQSPYLPKGKPDWWTFYGGDISGVLQKLDYLTDLGINLIYFNPLWEAKSNHKYDAADFMKVDPHFGSPEELQELVQEAHKRGIRIILDVAFNHSGESFWAFQDTVKKGDQSPYWHWYDWHKWPLPGPLPPDFKPRDYYQCWWGIKDMPDLNFDLSRKHPYENYIRDIRNAEVNWDLVNHILESSAWWVTEIGIDGFRLDVPDEVPWWFWQLFRERMKALKPELWLVGEIWNSARSWIDPRYFDSVMNYAYFKNPVLEFFVQKLIGRGEFCARITEGLAEYPAHAARAMMNLLGSHDTQRIMHLAAGNLQRLRQAVFFQMTFVGIPHIYYGDEIAMYGGKDPDNRRPFNWKWEEDERAVELREFYRELIRVRKREKLLWEGEFAFEESGDELLVYRRYDSSGALLCVMNLSDDMQNVECEGQVIFGSGELQEVDGGLHLGAGAICIIKKKAA